MGRHGAVTGHRAPHHAVGIGIILRYVRAARHIIIATGLVGEVLVGASHVGIVMGVSSGTKTGRGIALAPVAGMPPQRTGSKVAGNGSSRSIEHPIPGYNLQWQAVAEITYSGNPADSGDITSIQFFALPSTVQVVGGGKVLKSAGFNVTTAALENEIAALSATPGVDVIKSTKGNNIGQTVRVLAPNQFGGTKDSKGTSYYIIGGFPSFQAYVQAQYQSGATMQIAQKLNGVSYTFTGTADASGDIIITGVYSGVTYTITLQPDAPLTDGSGLVNYIQSWNIYSCPGAGAGVVTTGSDGTSSTAGNSSLPTNVQTQILHDLWCGYNFGFIGSTVIDPVTHVAFGTETSSVWFKDSTPATLYAGLQPAHPYYNQYAALINSASNGSAYGFPYADAVAGVTLFDVSYPGSPAVPVTAWNIIVGDPVVPSTDTPAMPAWALLLCGAALFGAALLVFPVGRGNRATR
jgi:hypothetical protein